MSWFSRFLVRLSLRLLHAWGRLSAKSASVDGVVWPYLEGGPEDGDVVVMVHGFGGDKNNWPIYARHFTKEYRVIAPDLPGFGEHVRNPDWTYGMVEQAERLHRFLAELGIDSCHFAGNSMGGFIGIYYALNYPEQLHSLTLIDNAGVTSRNKSELEIGIDEGKNFLVANTLEEFDELLAFISNKSFPSPGYMKKAMLHIQQQNYDFLDRLFWELADEALNHNVTGRLTEISVPTLVVWGRLDRVVDVSCAETMAADIPDNNVVIFDDVGHLPMLECPRETADHQLALVSRSTS